MVVAHQGTNVYWGRKTYTVKKKKIWYKQTVLIAILEVTGKMGENKHWKEHSKWGWPNCGLENCL